MADYRALYAAKLTTCEALAKQVQSGWTLCVDAGPSHASALIDAIAEKHNIPVVCKLPINPDVAAKCDRGAAEEYEGEWLDPMIDFLEKMD